MTLDTLLSRFHSMHNETNRAGMKRFGIAVDSALGISVKVLREIAKELKYDAAYSTPETRHTLALELWETGIHEARILAILVEHPRSMTAEQRETWVSDVNSWDLCDQLCSHLLRKLPDAWQYIMPWSNDEREFVKRAGFVLLAQLAVHDKKALDEAFTAYFPLLEQHAYDERNFVKKAINWAIRQIGKRNSTLRTEARILAERVHAQGTPSARWIARDALRELERPQKIPPKQPSTK